MRVAEGEGVDEDGPDPGPFPSSTLVGSGPLLSSESDAVGPGLLLPEEDCEPAMKAQYQRHVHRDCEEHVQGPAPCKASWMLGTWIWTFCVWAHSSANSVDTQVSLRQATHTYKLAGHTR